MKTTIHFVCALAVAACGMIAGSARGDDIRTIEGTIFIRTKGAESIKLALVNVMLFDQKMIAEHLEKKRKDAAPIDQQLAPRMKEAERVALAANEADSRVREVELATIAGEGKMLLILPYLKDNDFRRKMERIKAQTKEGQTLALSGTDYSQINTALREAAAKAQKATLEAREGLSEITSKAAYTRSAQYYFSDLPEAVQATKTDADGRFIFKAPSGSYVLVAESNRNAGREIELYDWMVKVTVANADKKVMLANDNLSSTESADSMIRTPADEEPVRRWMKGGDIHSLAAFVVSIAREQAAAELERFRENPNLAQSKAIEIYPQLGVPGSPLNTEFLARVKRYQAEKKDFFAEPDWPIRLGRECNDDLNGGNKQK